jgi:23S rRNA (uracil1939-C5)-methyltransferase
LKQALSSSNLATQLGHVELLEDSKGVSVLFRLTSELSAEGQSGWKDWAKKTECSALLASTESEQSGRKC